MAQAQDRVLSSTPSWAGLGAGRSILDWLTSSSSSRRAATKRRWGQGRAGARLRSRWCVRALASFALRRSNPGTWVTVVSGHGDTPAPARAARADGGGDRLLRPRCARSARDLRARSSGAHGALSSRAMWLPVSSEWLASRAQHVRDAHAGLVAAGVAVALPSAVRRSAAELRLQPLPGNGTVLKVGATYVDRALDLLREHGQGAGDARLL